MPESRLLQSALELPAFKILGTSRESTTARQEAPAIDAALIGKAEILAKPVDSQLLLDTVAAA